MRRGCGCLLVLLVVAGVGVFFADRAIAGFAERRAAERVGRELDAPAQVELEGFLPGVRLLVDRVPIVGISATDVPVRETTATASDLRIELREVSANLSFGAEFTGGAFQVFFDEEAVAQLIRQANPQVARVRLVDGRARVRIRGIGLVAATPALVDDALVLQTAGAQTPDLAADLPSLPDGVEVTGVRVRENRLVLDGVLSERLRTGLHCSPCHQVASRAAKPAESAR